MNVQASFETWMELMGGLAALSLVGLMVSIVEQKRRKRSR